MLFSLVFMPKMKTGTLKQLRNASYVGIVASGIIFITVTTTEKSYVSILTATIAAILLPSIWLIGAAANHFLNERKYVKN